MRVSSSSAQWQTAHAVAGHSGQFCDMAPLSGTPRAAEPIYRTHGRPSLRGRLRPGSDGPAQWHTARRRAYFTARTVARHSGDVCDQVPMARSRSSNHGAELTYGDEKNCDILRLSQSFLWKSDFYVENPIFLGLSVWFFVSRGWHLWVYRFLHSNSSYVHWFGDIDTTQHPIEMQWVIYTPDIWFGLHRFTIQSRLGVLVYRTLGVNCTTQH